MTSIFNDKNRNKLEEILSCYRSEMFVTAYSILKDYQAAEDTVQNAIIKIHRHLEKISEVKCKKTRSYIVIIVRNLCLDYFRGKKDVDSIDEMLDTLEDKQLSLEEHILKIEKSSEIAKQLDKLHRPYADILVLKYYHELSINDISDLLGISENNVNVRLKRALYALRNILEKEGDEVEKL